MTKVLVIPDVHLKPWIFGRAAQLAGEYDVAIALGDLVDDWGMQGDRDAYAETIEAAKAFAARNDSSLWCYGNHDYCYLHHDEGVYNTGFSDELKHSVKAMLRGLEDVVGERFKIIHEIDGVLFSHGGVSNAYLDKVRDRLGEDLTLEECVEFTNEVASSTVLWRDESPLWFRPTSAPPEQSSVEGVHQVVGHTPVTAPTQIDDILITDTFSTYSNGRPIGTQTLVIYDTETHEYEEV